MNRNDVILQSITTIIVLSVMNRILFHDSLAVAILFSAGIVVCYWMGRLSVRLVRRLKRASRLTDE